MNAASAVTVLIGAAELQVYVVLAEKMQEVVTLDKGVAKLSVADAGAAFADALLDELAIEELGHAEGLADFAKEWQEFDLAKPVVVVEDLRVGRGMGDADDLLGESGFVALDFVEAFEVALDGIFWIANLAGCAANKIIRSISVTHKTSAHHEGGKVANVKAIGAWIGTPIEIARSFV